MTNAAFATVNDFVEACMKAAASPKVEMMAKLEARLDVLFSKMENARTCYDYEMASQAYDRVEARLKALRKG